MFVCTLHDNAYVDYIVSHDESEHITRLCIGYCSATNCVYSLFIALSPYIGYADINGVELVFNIVQAQPDGSHTAVFWDGSETKELIPRIEDRAAIRMHLKTIVALMIEDAKPGIVSFTTHSAYLPEKALSKHFEVLDVIRKAGYTAETADSWHGRRTWMAQRNQTELPLGERPMEGME